MSKKIYVVMCDYLKTEVFIYAIDAEDEKSFKESHKKISTAYAENSYPTVVLARMRACNIARMCYWCYNPERNRL